MVLPQRVTLMTEGSGVQAVFILLAWRGILIHYEAEAAQLEEERRLAYVAITRARKRLYLTRMRPTEEPGSVQAILYRVLWERFLRSTLKLSVLVPRRLFWCWLGKARRPS